MAGNKNLLQEDLMSVRTIKIVQIIYYINYLYTFFSQSLYVSNYKVMKFIINNVQLS